MAKKKGKKKSATKAEEPQKEEEVVVEQAEEAPADEGGELTQLRKQLEEAEDQAAEYLDGWQRARAEFSNYKKRQEADRCQMAAFASGEMLRKLLPLIDDFERAGETLPDNLSSLTWCEGFFLIKHKLDAILESEGVIPIWTGGQKFDPVFHEAVSYEEAPGHEEGDVVNEIQRGYMLGDRVLRPALVRVAKAPRPESGEGEGRQESKE